MKNKILDFIHSQGISACGVTRHEDKSAIVCLFPYYCGDREGTPPMDYGAIGAWVLQKPLDEGSYAL